MDTVVIVYITAPSNEIAHEIVMHLLERRIIACANILKGESWYWWHDAVNQDAEAVVICKTLGSRVHELEEAVAGVHPYDTPCIMSYHVKTSNAYLLYVQQQVASIAV